MSEHTSEHDRVVEALLQRHGQTYAAEAGIDVAAHTPAPLFQTLCLALLFSAPIRASQAVEAMRALLECGWTTPEHMAEATWQQRVDVLNRSGYARFDEKTSTMLAEASEWLLDRYRGDLRRLRDEADNDPEKERERLKVVKGVGDVGVDIFFRETQTAWPELYPFADAKALEGAEALGLPERADDLAGLVEADRFATLVSALVRMQLADDAERVLEDANA